MHGFFIPSWLPYGDTLVCSGQSGVPSIGPPLVPITVMHKGMYHTFSKHMSSLIHLLSATCVFSVLCTGLPLPVCECTGCGGHDCGGDWETLPGL